ncbi:hypothetical protein [Salmonella sp. s54412]
METFKETFMGTFKGYKEIFKETFKGYKEIFKETVLRLFETLSWSSGKKMVPQIP